MLIFYNVSVVDMLMIANVNGLYVYCANAARRIYVQNTQQLNSLIHT